MSNRRSYYELRKLKTFLERFEYLAIKQSVGTSTFGYDRYLNQRFYGSKQWQQARRDVIARDGGCDLGVEGYEIFGQVLIHHINPLTLDDVEFETDALLDPDNLITTTKRTHNAIHFGDKALLPSAPVERSFRDTRLW